MMLRSVRCRVVRPLPLRVAFLAAAMFTLVQAPTVFAAVFDAFMFIDGLPGESTESAHKGWIDLASYGQDVNDQTCAKAVAIKFLDTASPGLAALAASGDKVPQVIVEAVKAGERPFLFFRATLNTARVASVGIVETEDGFLKEKVTFRPRQIVLEYIPQNASGGPGTPVTSTLNCKP
jgi:type VI secretion system secreted protein Hcp